MKWSRISWLTPSLVLMMAGAAMAGASSIGLVDTWGNNIGHMARAAGFAGTGVGALGVFHHVHTRSRGGAASNVGICFLGGVVTMDSQRLSPELGGTAAALIH